MKKFYILYFLLLCLPSYAYLDPGTGSMLIYSLLGIGFSLYFILKGLLIALISKLRFGKFHTSDNLKAIQKIVFFSEGGSYFNTFKPIIDNLCGTGGVKATYITADKNDIAFQYNSPNLNVINPGNILATTSFMNSIKADVVIATVPHLDIYMWKKSKNVKKYVHVFHAPTGVDFYEKYALCFYDIIFSVGDFTEKEQNALDIKRNLPLKKYYQVGCPYYDLMLEEYQKSSLCIKQDDRTILYAPTWGCGRSSFFTVGQKLIKDLLNAKYKVIFRPHPQFFITHKTEFDNFKKELCNYNNLEIDTNKTVVNSMLKSSMLISDFSGVVFDYAYVSSKPILLLNVTNATSGYEAEELNEINVSFDVDATLSITHTLTAEEIGNIVDTVERYIGNTKNKDRLNLFRSQNLYHFGCAGKTAAQAIMEIETQVEDGTLS